MLYRRPPVAANRRNARSFSVSMKVFMATSYYPAIIRAFERASAGCQTASYDEYYKELMASGFGWSDYFEEPLARLGAEARTVVTNANSLQRKWATEHQHKWNSPLDILERQIEEFGPDVIFFQNSSLYPERWIRKIKTGGRKLVTWRGSPFTRDDVALFSLYDLVLTCSPVFQKRLSSLGLRTGILNFGFSRRFSDYSAPFYARSKNITFAGSVVQGDGYHNDRMSFLLEIERLGRPIDIYAEKLSTTSLAVKKSFGLMSKALGAVLSDDAFSKLPRMLRRLDWASISPLNSKINRMNSIVKTPVYGKDFFRLLSNSKICLNFHIDSAGEYAANSRLFEATGCGALLLSDRKKNNANFFKLDQEMLDFNSSEECIEKIEWVMKNPSAAAKIAEAGRARCLRDHSTDNRAADLFAHLTSI